VAPNRSLVVAAHSGGPDWGSGPSGNGQLFKITHADVEAPIPSLVWADGPREVRVAFDRPVDPEMLKDLAAHTAIEGGEFVAAADRFEILRPGYAAVEYQQTASRFGVDVQGLQLTADRRTLILSTAPHVAAVSYAVALAGLKSSPSSTVDDGQLAQLPDMDLQYDLSGVEATWAPEAGAAWRGWLPHLDLNVSRSFTQASAMHDQLWQFLDTPGELTLRATVNLRDMLRPAVQIGSTIDYAWPQEEVTLTFQSNSRFQVKFDGEESTAARADDGMWRAKRTVAVGEVHNFPLEVRLQKMAGGSSPTLTVHFHTQEDARPRALQSRRFSVPWARPVSDAAVVVDNRQLPELKGGNWLRGRREFFGSDAGCAKCHQVRGEGSSIAPDLSNLTKRDYASVLRDITQPSFAINPDFVTQLVVTTDGRVLSGTVRTDDDRLIVSDQEGKETVISRDDVEEVQSSELSIMPEGIPKALGPDRLRDLLTFLLVDPPSMPVYGELPPPPRRTLKEVNEVLAGERADAPDDPMHVVLVAGPKDHGLGEHDYPAWQTAWRALFEMDEQVTVATADPWPGEEDLKSADVLVFYQQGAWTPERARDIDRFLRRGGGLVYIHYAVDGGSDPAGFAERIGLAWQGLRSKFRHGPLDVEFVPGSKHPIARNLDRVHLHDESYWNLVGDTNRINLLASGVEEENPQPLFWTFEPEVGGRVFVSIPGHFAWTFDDPIFRILILRGIAWTAEEDVDRLNNLVLPGARVEVGTQN
jgi:putative heme-binding domain-containing protein